MPNKNGTGPTGKGPMTGGCFGVCTADTSDNKIQEKRRSRGMGRCMCRRNGTARRLRNRFCCTAEDATALQRARQEDADATVKSDETSQK